MRKQLKIIMLLTFLYVSSGIHVADYFYHLSNKHSCSCNSCYVSNSNSKDASAAYNIYLSHKNDDCIFCKYLRTFQTLKTKIISLKLSSFYFHNSIYIELFIIVFLLKFIKERAPPVPVNI